MSKPKGAHARAKADTWELFSAYIRIRDAIRTTGAPDECECVTCGRRKPLFRTHDSIQAGHFIPGRHNAILFDARGCHGQCSYCNDHLRGNWVRYMEFMLLKYGEDVIDELIDRDRQTVSWKTFELEGLQEQLRVEIRDLISSCSAEPSDAVKRKLKELKI